MNALEMAEEMEGRARVRRKITNRENTGDRLSDQLEQAATMLRQQQAEIEALKAAKIRAYNNGVEDGRKPDTNNEPIAWDRGTWTVGETESQEFIESSDFNHDVRLYLNGDFEDNTQRLNYLKHIADRLNTHPVKEDEGKVCAMCGAIAYDPVITQTVKEQLTDEEINELWLVTCSKAGEVEDMQLHFARAILLKAQEK